MLEELDRPAEIVGAGMSSDAYHITAGEPEGAGAARAMQEAVADGGLSMDDIVHINAHATSTPVGDLAEAKAIRRAFGPRADQIAVTATKSMTGHLLGAAGALEAVLTVQALHHRQVPATINLENKDPQIDLDVVTGGEVGHPHRGRHLRSRGVLDCRYRRA